MGRIDFFDILPQNKKKQKKGKSKLTIDKILEGELKTIGQISSESHFKQGAQKP